uniref:uncharacterized protein LOC122588116 n=1 Tax=Erigeron canadensis TaxID=72917 RepID=UPI001CB92E83|nr:uncharacterized protein LOC122588116 [Erigeron canadensis]
MVAITIILSFSGLIGFQDITFVILSSFYMFFLSKFAFPTLSTTPAPPVFARHQRLLTAYVSVGALIGLVLPIAYIVHGVLLGDKEGVKAAAPHVFLLASQVLMESVTFSGGFSLPIRVFVPVCYNAMRMYAIMDWVKSEIMKGLNDNYDEKLVVENGISERRLFFGRCLAFGNLVFWGFNLFGFLVPFYLPKAFKKYYDDVGDDNDSKDKDS